MDESCALDALLDKLDELLSEPKLRRDDLKATAQALREQVEWHQAATEPDDDDEL